MIWLGVLVGCLMVSVEDDKPGLGRGEGDRRLSRQELLRERALSKSDVLRICVIRK